MMRPEQSKKRPLLLFNWNQNIPMSAWRNAFGLVLTAVCVSVTVIVLWRLSLHLVIDGRLSPDMLRDYLADWQSLAPLVSILLMVIYSLMPLPAAVMAIANGMVFGPVAGTAITWLGALIGALLAYGLARGVGKPAIDHRVPQRFRAVFERWTRYIGAGELLVVRLIPVVSFTLINYAAGLAGVRLGVFLWTTALGILPLTTASVLIGHGALAWPPAVWLAVVLGAIAMLLVTRRLAAKFASRPVAARSESL